MAVTKDGKTVVLPEGMPALGYARLDNLAGATELPDPPERATWARIYVEVGSIRFRDDGEPVTVDIGAPWSAGAYFEAFDLQDASLIETTAGSVVTVEYHE